MFEHKFDYSDSPVSVSKIIYDLSLIYARAKFEDKLRNNYDFYKSAASEEVEQAQYLMDEFLWALDYYSGLENGDLERHYAMLYPNEKPKNQE